MVSWIDTAERHIPKCKTIANRPKPPKSSINEEAQTTMYESKAKPPRPSKKIESQSNLDDVQDSRPLTQYTALKSNEKAFDMRSATAYQKTPKGGADGSTQKLFGANRKPQPLETSETHRYSREYSNSKNDNGYPEILNMHFFEKRSKVSETSTSESLETALRAERNHAKKTVSLVHLQRTV